MAKYLKTFSSFSTNDLQAARKFYGDILQLAIKERDQLLELDVPGASVLVYPKDNHEPATFTVLNFVVSDLQQEVAALKQKGVVFESYDFPGFKTNEDNILVDEKMQMKIAWFTDTAGNILSLIEEQKAKQQNNGNQ